MTPSRKTFSWPISRRVGAPLVAGVLRLAADHRAGEKAVAFADRRMAGDRDVRLQLAAVAQRHVGPDVAERSDFDVLAELGPGIDMCQV